MTLFAIRYSCWVAVETPPRNRGTLETNHCRASAYDQTLFGLALFPRLLTAVLAATLALFVLLASILYYTNSEKRKYVIRITEFRPVIIRRLTLARIAQHFCG